MLLKHYTVYVGLLAIIESKLEAEFRSANSRKADPRLEGKRKADIPV